jgi:hypothetical protein
MTEDAPADDEVVAERLAELNGAVEDLRTELRAPPRGPLGLPRPPTPREVSRFTAEYTIPAAIATLEATARSLELLQAVLRATDPAARESDLRNRAERAGGAVLARLDDALADLQTAVEEGSLPSDPAARDLLADARELSAETRDALTDERAGATPDRAGDGTDDRETTVEDELETIKREVDRTPGPEDGGGENDDSQA